MYTPKSVEKTEKKPACKRTATWVKVYFSQYDNLKPKAKAKQEWLQNNNGWPSQSPEFVKGL